MPPWAWILVAVAVLLAVVWLVDRRTKARGAWPADPSAMTPGGHW